MVEASLFCPPTVGLLRTREGISTCLSCWRGGLWVAHVKETRVCGPGMSASEQVWFHMGKQVEMEDERQTAIAGGWGTGYGGPCVL